MSRIVAALVTAVMTLAAPLVPRAGAVTGGGVVSPTAPAHSNIQVQVCRDLSGGSGVDCGTAFPQQAAWIAILVTRAGGLVDVAVIKPSGVQMGCTWLAQRTPFRVTCHAYGARSAPAVGTWHVRVADAVSHAVLADYAYERTPQTPAEAIAAYRNRRDAWARATVTLARARGGDLSGALAGAQSMARDSDLTIGYEGHALQPEILLALHRPADAVRAAQDLISWKRAHGWRVWLGEYLLLASVALQACDLSMAEQAAGQASLAAPGDPRVEQTLVQIEQARANCGTLPPSSPGGGESQ